MNTEKRKTSGMPKVISKSLVSAVFMLTAVMTMSVGAQAQQYNRHSYGVEPFVSIYEDCHFRGERRDISMGEFRSMRELDFGNDKISSIQVPAELEVTIYEDDKFRGDYTTVTRDVRCFDRGWNDQVSSLKVEYRDQPQRQVYGGSAQSNGYVHDDHRTQPRGNSHNGVNGYNVTQVMMGSRVLKVVGEQQWKYEELGRSAALYKEVSRDKKAVILLNESTAQRIRIDLTANNVMIVGSRGAIVRHQITSRKAGSESVQTPMPDTRIANRCFEYRVYTDGNAGGIRFSNDKTFYRFQDRAYNGRICHRGELIVEMNKRDFDTDLTLEIAGRTFKFAAGEKETQYRANWYRKVIKLQVGS